MAIEIFCHEKKWKIFQLESLTSSGNFSFLRTQLLVETQKLQLVKQ